MRPPIGNGDGVILLHGQAANRANMLGNADLLLRHGYAVLLPDARAHGESGGPIATYGVVEASDVRRWYELAPCVAVSVMYRWTRRFNGRGGASALSDS